AIDVQPRMSGAGKRRSLGIEVGALDQVRPELIRAEGEIPPVAVVRRADVDRHVIAQPVSRAIVSLCREEGVRRIVKVNLALSDIVAGLALHRELPGGLSGRRPCQKRRQAGAAQKNGGLTARAPPYEGTRYETDHFNPPDGTSGSADPIRPGAGDD